MGSSLHDLRYKRKAKTLKDVSAGESRRIAKRLETLQMASCLDHFAQLNCPICASKTFLNSERITGQKGHFLPSPAACN